MQETTVTIRPNEKYRYVVDGCFDPTGTKIPDHDSVDEATRVAAGGYLEVVENTPTVEEMGADPETLTELSWGDFNVCSDPDLVARMATYFDGMDPAEPTDLLRAKLRLLDCEVYANAQIAAREELRAD